MFPSTNSFQCFVGIHTLKGYIGRRFGALFFVIAFATLKVGSSAAEALTLVR